MQIIRTADPTTCASWAPVPAEAWRRRCSRESGARVVVLEAGPKWDSATDSAMFRWPYESPRRGAATPERHFGEFDGCIGGWQLDGEPVHRRAGAAVALVSRAHARRPYEPLGPDLAALGAGRLPQEERGRPR